MKILVISLAGVGDTLLATPLIHELRAIYPAAVIDVLVLWPGSRDILEGNPYLNSVFQKNLIKKSNKLNQLAALRFLWSLRPRHYDVSINTHPQSKILYRVAARIINARTRISHNYHQSKWFDRLLGDHTLPQDYEKHSVENTLALLQFLGVQPVLPHHDCELFLSPGDIAWADAFLSERNLGARKRFGIHVGTSGTKNLALRRWPVDHYLSLIQRMNQNHPEVAILLFGGPEEERAHEQILARTSHRHVFVVKTANFRQTAALLRTCDLFISGDTSLMHLAAVVKVPKQFVIETPTFYKPNYPYHQPFSMIRNPEVAGRNLLYYLYDGRGIRGTNEELRRCMASITVDSVYQTLQAACPFLQGSR
jgi:ADP-heptose:LPS heptosyltransferase